MHGFDQTYKRSSGRVNLANVLQSLKRRLGCIGKDLMRGVALSKGSGLSIFQSYSGEHNTNIVLACQVLFLTTALSFAARTVGLQLSPLGHAAWCSVDGTYFHSAGPEH